MGRSFVANFKILEKFHASVSESGNCMKLYYFVFTLNAIYGMLEIILFVAVYIN